MYCQLQLVQWWLQDLITEAAKRDSGALVYPESLKTKAQISLFF